MTNALKRALLAVLVKHNAFGALIAVVQETPRSDGYEPGGFTLMPHDDPDREEGLVRWAAVCATQARLATLIDE